MILGVHGAIAALSQFKSTDRVAFEQHVEGHRKHTSMVVKTVGEIASRHEDAQSGLLITVAKDPYKRGERNLWTRLTCRRYRVFIAGPAWACQVYLHGLEGQHGHRR
jgi:phenylalanine-4-hydroxylase